MNKSALLQLVRASDLSALDLRERMILEHHVGLNRPRLTLEEIGKLFGVTRERVRQIEKQALGKLRPKT